MNVVNLTVLTQFRLLIQLAEPFRRFGNILLLEVLVLASVIDDLLQPVPRPNRVLRQAVAAFEERPAKSIRAELRTQTRRLGHVHHPKYIVLGPTKAFQEIMTKSRHPPWVAGRRAALVPRAGLHKRYYTYRVRYLRYLRYLATP